MELSDHQTGQLHLALLQRLLQPELSWLELSSWPFPARAAARLGLDLRVQLSFELCQLGLLEHLRNGS